MRRSPGISQKRLLTIAVAIAMAAYCCYRVMNPSLPANDVSLIVRQEASLDSPGKLDVLNLTVGGHPISVKAVVLTANLSRGWIVPQNEPGPEHLHLARVCEDQHALAGVNGGYFDEKFNPVGLLTIGEKAISPMTSKPSLSAVVGFDSAGRLHLCRSSEDTSTLTDAVQAGPFVINPGGTIGIAPGSLPVARRTIIALTTTNDVVLVSTSDASLYEAAEIMRHMVEFCDVSPIDRAVNLDGGPSAAMFTAGGMPDWQITETGPVRDFILFRPTTFAWPSK